MHTFLLIFWMLFFLTTFVWRTYVNYRRYGQNPLVLQTDDSPYGYISKAFKGVILLIFLITLQPLTVPLHWQEVFAPGRWSGITGVALMVLSLILVLMAQVHLGKSWRIGIDTQVKTDLVTSGIYRHSRNPIFLGMRIALLGFFLATPTFPVFITLLLGEILMQIQVRLEEEHLTRVHGKIYQTYQQHTRRWI